ncbi:MAG TPA: GNAT family protein [Methylomirabilota bacterium]|jgi:RimJ/RimL family protein N-acetyltransferase|nr:GNAT family protein [Methylomirabilota bacterium]
MLGPLIEGERIRLEPPRPEFAPAYQRWFADTEVTRYLVYRNPLTTKQQEDWLETIAKDEHVVLWAITVKENDRLIGNTAVERISWRNRRGESGIVIGEKDAWGKGYATEAMRLRTRYAFNELGLNKVVTWVILPNDASRRALERVGYRQCGLMRRHQFVDGHWYDAWLGEILKDEWDARQEKTS